MREGIISGAKEMTRRKFMKTSGASALVTAGTTGGALAGNAAQTKGKKSKKKVSTDRAPKPVGPYNQAIVAGNTIYVAGKGHSIRRPERWPPPSMSKRFRSSRTSKRSW